MNLSLPVLTLCLFFGFFVQGQICFSAPIAVAPDNTYGPRAPRIALVEGNRPLVYWRKAGNNATLYLARWEGTEFGEPMALSTGNVEPDLFSGGLGPQLAAQGNIVYLVFEKYGQGIYFPSAQPSQPP